jgi:hypothetical protein
MDLILLRQTPGGDGRNSFSNRTITCKQRPEFDEEKLL